MAENWYYSIDDKNHGPLNYVDMKRLVHDDMVKADTLVWNEQMTDWAPAQDSEIAKLLKTHGGTIDIAGRHHCSVCGNNYAQNELVDLDGSLVCAGCKPQMLRMMQAGGSALGNVAYAGFWIRAGATILDGFVMFGVQFLVGFILGMIMSGNSNLGIITGIFNLLVGFSYVVGMIATKGATLGQMAVHIRTINADGSIDISWGKSIGRYFAYMLNSFTLGIGFLMVAFDREKRALHDMICATRVVYTNK